MHKKILPLLLIIGLYAAHSSAQTVGKGDRGRLIAVVDSIIGTNIGQKHIPGAVVEIKKGNDVLCRQAFGYAERNDYDNRPLQHPVVMTIQDLFDLASLTKMVGTTTAVMLLVDRGKLKLDDPVGKYIPAFNYGEKKQIKIRNLLTHTAGLIEWYPLFYRASGKAQTYRVIGELPLKYPVGAGRHYSDLGFILLGQIIEKVSGIPLDRFDEEYIFKPLGMLHTTYNPLKKGFTKFAATSHGNPFETRMVYDSSLGYTFKEIHPHQWNGWRQYTLAGEVNDGNAWYALHGVSGHAGLFSTVDDLQKLVDMLKSDGKTDGRQFISKKTLHTFLTKDSFNNGLGWMMDTSDAVIKGGPPGTFGHTGFTGTSIAVVPSLDVSVILLINRQNMGLQPTGYYYNPSPIRRELFQAVLQYFGYQPASLP